MKKFLVLTAIVVSLFLVENAKAKPKSKDVKIASTNIEWRTQR